MIKLRGLLPLCAALCGLLALMGAKEAKAASVPAITVEIIDLTTSTTTGPITFGSAANTTPSTNQFTVNSGTSASDTAGSGVTLTGLVGTETSSSISNTSSLSLSGTAIVTGGGTDTYEVIVTATSLGYNIPSTGPSTMMESNSGTWTYSTGKSGDGQNFQGWYDPTNSGSSSTPYTPGQQTIAEPTALNGTQSGIPSPSSVSTTISSSVYAIPYSLTETYTIFITGSGSTSKAAQDQFQGSVTVSGVVPEPASMVMFLTGMPVPLMVLGMLRRRKATAKS